MLNTHYHLRVPPTLTRKNDPLKITNLNLKELEVPAYFPMLFWLEQNQLDPTEVAFFFFTGRTWGPDRGRGVTTLSRCLLGSESLTQYSWKGFITWFFTALFWDWNLGISYTSVVKNWRTSWIFPKKWRLDVRLVTHPTDPNSSPRMQPWKSWAKHFCERWTPR